MAVRQRTYTIDKWLGVNESPDGDTGLNLGEACSMRNFKITKEGNLQVRPGYAEVCGISEGHPVRGLWHGYINGVEYLLSACNGHVWKHDLSDFTATDLGEFNDAPTNFFAFGNKVYLQNGTQYYSYDGTTFGSVAGYVPIIATECDPATGGGNQLQQVNKLTGSKIQWFSTPTDGATTYHLLEQNIDSVDSVTVNGEAVTTGYSVNTTAGTVTFSSPVSEGHDNVKIQYTAGTGDRHTIEKQKFCEMFMGATDNRVVFYGDGTNKAYYSGVEYATGLPTAEYFPDLNVLNIGEENTPITAMIRHFNKLMSFKPNGTYLTDFDIVTLEGGEVTPAFYTRPIDRDTGNDVYGQVKLVNNYPISLTNKSAYRWNLIYSSGTIDERVAKPISNRVSASLGNFNTEKIITFDDAHNREFWIHDTSLKASCIYSYVNETDYSASYKNNLWYIYTDIDATCFLSYKGEVYFGTSNGYLMRFSRDYRSDAVIDGGDVSRRAIDAYWESGAMTFDAEYMRKMVSRHFVVLKPEGGARVEMTLETDRKSDFDTKEVSAGISTMFTHTNFGEWSFNFVRKPKTKRIKLKAKKFTSLKLMLSSKSSTGTATVLSYTAVVNYGSYAK